MEFYSLPLPSLVPPPGDEDEVTVGKFYATFLIQVCCSRHQCIVRPCTLCGLCSIMWRHDPQDYFRRFKKKKETRLAEARQEQQEDLTVSLQVLIVLPPTSAGTH
jgi:hypothetical protein